MASEPILPPLPRLQRADLTALRRAFSPYRDALATMSTTELTAELTRINALLEQQSRASLTAQFSSESRSSLDDPVSHSTRVDPWSSTPNGQRSLDRGQPRSPSPQPGPYEVRLGAKKQGPRLAAKLVAAEHRRAARR